MFSTTFLYIAMVLMVNSNVEVMGRPTIKNELFSWDHSKHATRKIKDHGKYDGRSYLVHLPKHYDETKQYPVVLSFHGNGGTSSKQEKISQLSEKKLKINDLGIIAVYPQASKGKGKKGEKKGFFQKIFHKEKASWQGAPYAADGVDDIGFTKLILDEITEHLSVDKKRIYATGKSNGGGFTNLLACTPEINSRIAAFAVVSGALYPGTHPGTNSSDSSSACDPKKLVPMLISHGYDDTTIPYKGQSERDGSTDYRTPDIDEFAKAWAERNAKFSGSSNSSSKAEHSTSTSTTSTSTSTTSSSTPTSTSGASHEHSSSESKSKIEATASEPHKKTELHVYPSKVLLYSVHDFKHCWPSKAGLDCDKASFDLTQDDLVKFLEANPLA